MERFILVDGNAILHRAYHALPPLTNPKGIVVNAVYGFFTMFLKILEDFKPHFIAVCFDRPKPTFRKQMYAGYQATRPQMASDLSPQIGIVHSILEKAHVPIFEIDGYEADDLIGTLSVEIPKSLHNTEVIIVSGDRDLLQLVNGKVRMLAPVVGITNTTLYDSEKVKEKFGIEPEQIVDYKALVGDSSDNYPGVSGIGPKTASNLLKMYHSLENLYAHLGDVPPKVSEKLAQDAEQAALCKKLATIVTDAPIHIQPKECSIEQFNITGARKAFEELGSKSLVKRLETSVAYMGILEEKKKASSKKQDGQLGFF